MKEFTLEVKSRGAQGKGASSRYRRDGLIPAIVYHRGEASVPALLDYEKFLRLAQSSRSSQIFTMTSEDGHLNGKTVVVKDIQRDYVKNKVIHVDFQALREDEEVTVRIPLDIFGDPIGVKLEGGIVSVHLHEVAVRCVPKLIPEELKIDISELHLNQSVHVRDLKVADGVTFETDLDDVIVVVELPKKIEEEAPAAAAVPAEGEAAAAAAPAADGQPAAGAAAATDKDKKAAPEKKAPEKKGK